MLNLILTLFCKIFGLLLAILTPIWTVLEKGLLLFLVLLHSCHNECITENKSDRDIFAETCGLEDASGINEVRHETDAFFALTAYYRFRAPQPVIDKIARSCNLAKAGYPHSPSSSFRPEWWQSELEKKVPCYFFNDEKKRENWTLWYDPETEYGQLEIFYY